MHIKNDKKRSQSKLGKPHVARLVSTVYNQWNPRYEFNQEAQIQTN